MRTLSYHSYSRQNNRCQRGLTSQKTRHLVISFVCVFPCGWLNFIYCSSFILFVTLFIEFLHYTVFWSTVAVFKSTKSSQIVARKKSMLYYATEQRKPFQTFFRPDVTRFVVAQYKKMGVGWWGIFQLLHVVGCFWGFICVYRTRMLTQ